MVFLYIADTVSRTCIWGGVGYCFRQNWAFYLVMPAVLHLFVTCLTFCVNTGMIGTFALMATYIHSQVKPTESLINYSIL
jgi:hypothetical protein